MLKPKGMMLFILVIVLMALSCSGPESDQPVLTAEMPLHLEEHLDDAKIVGSEVPEDLPAPIEWSFDVPQPDWEPTKPIPPKMAAIRPVRVENALRLPLNIKSRIDDRRPRLLGGINVALPDLNVQEWAYVEIRARTPDPCRNLGLDFNYSEDDPIGGAQALFPFYSVGDRTPLIADGTIHTYRLFLDWRGTRNWEGPWTHLGIWFNSQNNEEAVTLDILSVRIIPKEYVYADAPLDVKTIERSKTHRRTLYTHAPGRIEYRVRVPESGRLDFGAEVIKEDSPVTFRVIASQKGEEITLFEETYADPKEWRQHSVDLSSIAGKTVTLVLEADAERSGSVALWSAPTLTGQRSTHKPNIILYVIDGAGAGDMSVYGYNRRTTPNLERLAAEGAFFETAFSNCAWTKVSNPSFMTSLYNSILGGFKSESDPLPDQAVIMAQHMHKAGYQTGVFVSNAYAGTMTSFDRGVDFLREDRPENRSASSKELHEKFWEWRSAFPSEPYWVHFQTTDVHGPTWHPEAPFAGLFVSSARRQSFYEWFKKVRAIGVYPFTADELWEKVGVSRQEYANVRRSLYDETMAHNDYQIGQLVKRLKSTGEWDHTLLIVTADHGHEHAARAQLDPLPPKYGSPIFANFTSRIPMIFVWPEKIAPGQRISHPVSLIDMLPTILDLADLPMPEIMQGQSLAPLLLGEEGWEPRPVIFDEFYFESKSGEFKGKIEVVDGRWGASLGIGLSGEPFWYDPPATERRPSPLLLYDVWNDPYCLVPLNDKYPELVEKYTKFLQERWEAHQALAKHFRRSKDSTLKPEQLEILRSLGYIR